MNTLSITSDTAIHMPNVSIPNTTPPSEVSKDTSPSKVDANKEHVDMTKLAQQLNTVAKKENLDISFGYNKEIDRVVISVLDKNTGEVIRKLPSEDAVKFAEGVKDLLGKLFDKKG